MTPVFGIAFLTAASFLALSGCQPKASQNEVKSVELAAEPEADSDERGNDALEECVQGLAENDKQYALATRLWVGKAKGQCVMNTAHRPTRQLPLDQAAAIDFANDGVNAISIMNVSHIGPGSKESTFWLAEIHPKDVKAVYFQLEHFPTLTDDVAQKIIGKMPKPLRPLIVNDIKFLNDFLAAHTQIRLQFNKPIKLRSQVNGELTTTNDLVFSVEAVGQKGYAFDLVAGLQKNFVAVHRITTYEQKFYDMVVMEEFGKPKNHIVEQGLMKFSDDPAKNSAVMEKLVRVYLNRSAQNWAQMEAQDDASLYHTKNYNCTTEVIRSMDQALLESGTLSRFDTLKYKGAMALTQPVFFFPMVTHWALQNRGLLTRGKDLKVYAAPTMCSDPAMADIKARFGLDKTPCVDPVQRPTWLTGEMRAAMMR